MFRFLNTFLRNHNSDFKKPFTMVIPYSWGGTGNKKLFKIKSWRARFLRFEMNVVQYDQISQFGVGARMDFGQIRPDDTEWPYWVQTIAYRKTFRSPPRMLRKYFVVHSMPTLVVEVG